MRVETRAWVALVVALAGAVGCGGASNTQEPAKPAAAEPEIELPKDPQARAAFEAAERGDWRDAAQRFAELRRKSPEDVDLVVNQGVALERSGQLAAAIEAYEAASALDPTDPAAARYLARALVATENVERAKRVLRQALAEHPDHPELLAVSASVFRMAGNAKKAIELARRVLLRDQKNVPAMKTLALAYADRGKLQLADTFFRNALELDPDDASIHVSLGLLHFRRGEDQRALARFEKAITVDASDAAAHANIGAIALRYRDYSRAAQAYQQAVDAGLVTCETLSALGYAYEGAQQGSQAVSQLERAYALCPNDAELLYRVGTICMGLLQDNRCALDYFTRYTESKKALANDHPVHLMIESLRQREGQREATPPPPEEASESTEEVGRGTSAGPRRPSLGRFSVVDSLVRTGISGDG